MFNACCRYFPGRLSAGRGIWSWVQWKGLPRLTWSTLTWKLLCMYECIWMCVFLHAWAGNWKEWGSSRLMGCLERARPLGQQWDEVQLLSKVHRAVRGVYSGGCRRGIQREGCREVSQENGKMWGGWRFGETKRKRSAYCKHKDVRADLHQQTDTTLTELILRTLSDCPRSQTKAFVQSDSRVM